MFNLTLNSFDKIKQAVSDESVQTVKDEAFQAIQSIWDGANHHISSLYSVLGGITLGNAIARSCMVKAYAIDGLKYFDGDVEASVSAKTEMIFQMMWEINAFVAGTILFGGLAYQMQPDRIMENARLMAFITTGVSGYQLLHFGNHRQTLEGF